MKKYLSPFSISILLILLFLGFFLARSDGDPLVFAEIGTRYSQSDPAGTEGYDGQFVYFIAQDLNPETVAPYLDSPAYRYQRIVLPLLARLLSFGQPNMIAWLIPLISLSAHLLAVSLLAKLLQSFNQSKWLALVYGLWVGFLLALRLDLPEPLAYAFIIFAIFAQQKGKKGWSWLFYGLAIFTKEVTIFFILAQILHDLLNKRWKVVIGLSLTAILPFAIFQFWLFQNFGTFGIGSGGELATSFEWIPFMGIFRIGEFSMLFLAAILLIYIPAIIFPVGWAIWKTVKLWIKGKLDYFSIALFLNAIILVFIPFSTYREPNGTLRLLGGLILSLLLFAAKYNHKRALNYSYLYLVLNVFLLRL